MLQPLVAVKALIVDRDRFLVLKSADSDSNDPLAGWETPGGRMEENELPVESLLREVREETGLSIHVLFAFNTFMIGKGTDRCTVGINYVAALQSSAANIVLSDEHTAFRWSTLLGLRSLAKSIGLQKELDAYESFRKSVAAFGF